MSYMVIYKSQGSDPAYAPFSSLDDAAAYVEAKSNEAGFDEVHIFRLERIDFEIRPYYRVHLGHNPPELPASAAPAPGSADAAPSDDERRGWFDAAGASGDEPSPHASSPETVFEQSEPETSVATAHDDEPSGAAGGYAPDYDAENEAATAGRRGLFGR